MQGDQYDSKLVERHAQMWHQFTKFVGWSIGFLIVLLVLMAMFLID